MRIKIKVEEVSSEEAHAPDGIGYWGVKLGPNEVMAYECPTLGDGGASEDNYNLLAWIFSHYTGKDELNAEDGPDEALYAYGGRYYLVTIYLK